MTYITFNFFVFVTCIIILYYLIPLKYRWFALLAGNLAFYWYLSQYSKRRFMILIIMSFISWVFGIMTEKEKKSRKTCLIFSVLFTIIPFLIFKEFQFVFETAAHRSVPDWWLVPVGISFFSMQLISYNVDIYKKEITAERNYLKFLLFVSFFPQILQGPIPRYSQLSGQLVNGNRFDERKFVKGFMLILWGFFLKLCIADKAGIVVNTVFDGYPGYLGTYIVLAGILYSLQLYADFLACTSLAQGVAGLFGIELADNFLHPYFSRSIKEFWRRWHISLSSWLRDYIYFPLGGSRKGNMRKYVNILITFLASGIWHGAGYKYIFWGLLHGFYQIVCDITVPLKDRLKKLPIFSGKILWNSIAIIITFTEVMLAWIIFRAEHLKSGLLMIRSIFTVYNPWILTNDSIYDLGLSWKEFHILILCIVILLLVSIIQEKGISIRERILKLNLASRWLIYISAILFIMIFGTYGFGYDAQAFIYGGF